MASPSPLSQRAVSDFLSGRTASNEAARQVAAEVIAEVKSRGFAALQEYSGKFDGYSLTKENAVVSEDEIRAAADDLLPQQRRAMREMKKRIASFAGTQKASMGEVKLAGKEGRTSLRFIPVERVGIYVPAGRAPLFSSLFMAALPAQVAGVKEIIVCTPPQKNGKASSLVLAAARMCGISKVCKLGGAQAIAAMAFGVDGLFAPADVICGPGNAYVSAAKQLAASEGLRIDVPAGPSEVLVIADESANAAFAAADMLAQAEHGADSAAICICLSGSKAKEVEQALSSQLSRLPADSPAQKSIPKWGRIWVARSRKEAVDAANEAAPEHLELLVEKPEEWIPELKNAGAVFLNTAEAFCDYGMSGGNHILPTGRAARAWGGVSVQTFGKWMYVENLAKGAQAKLAATAALLARMEGLEAHALAAEARGGSMGRGKAAKGSKGSNEADKRDSDGY